MVDQPSEPDPVRQVVSPEAALEADESSLELQVRARAFYLAPGGRIIFPATHGTSKDVDVEMLNLDGARLAPGFEIDVSTKQWHFLGNYTEFENSDRWALSPTTRRIGDVDVAKGDEIVSSLRFNWGQFQVGRTIIEHEVGNNAKLHLTAGIGARYYDMSMSMNRLAGGRAHADPTFVEPVAAGELRFTYREAYGVRLAFDAGYSDWSGKTTSSWGVTFESSASVNDVLSAQIGYRILTFELDEGSGSSLFEYNGSLAGLYAGLSFTF